MEKLWVIAGFVVLGICIIFATTQQTTEGTLTTGARQSSSSGVQPGDTVTFTCTIPSLAHRWESPSLRIARSLTAADQGVVIPDPPVQFAVIEVIPGTSITSTVTLTATASLNGTDFLCRDGFQELPDPQSYILIVTGYSTTSTPSTVHYVTPSHSFYSTHSSSIYPKPTNNHYPTPTNSSDPSPYACGAGCIGIIINIIIVAVLAAVGLVAVVLCVYRSKDKQHSQARPKSTPNADTPLLPQYHSKSPQNASLHGQQSALKETRLDPPIDVDAILNSATGTSPELPPHIQQPPIESYENIHVDARKALSAENDGLSQDPTPSSTCASHELLPHVQQQPVEEEETDKNVVARKASSVENDGLSQDPTPSSTCASPKLLPHVQQQPIEEEETDKNVVAREASSVKNDELSEDPTPSSTCASPELPPHVQQQAIVEEEIDKNVSTNVVAREASSAENDPTPSSTCASPELPPHVPMEEEKTGDSMDAEEECSGPSPSLPMMESSSDPSTSTPKQLDEIMETYTKKLKSGNDTPLPPPPPSVTETNSTQNSAVFDKGIPVSTLKPAEMNGSEQFSESQCMKSSDSQTTSGGKPVIVASKPPQRRYPPQPSMKREGTTDYDPVNVNTEVQAFTEESGPSETIGITLEEST